MTDHAQRADWFARNWKWLLPVVGGAVLLGVVSCAGGIVFFVMHMVRSSEVHDLAFERASQHPAVVERLGQPIEEGSFVLGNIHVNATDGSGEANLQIPIKGPNGKAQINVEATRTNHVWTMHLLNVEFADPDDVIAILPDNEFP